jgi:hypothetical protein
MLFGANSLLSKLFCLIHINLSLTDIIGATENEHVQMYWLICALNCQSCTGMSPTKYYMDRTVEQRM